MAYACSFRRFPNWGSTLPSWLPTCYAERGWGLLQRLWRTGSSCGKQQQPALVHAFALLEHNPDEPADQRLVPRQGHRTIQNILCALSHRLPTVEDIVVQVVVKGTDGRSCQAVTGAIVQSWQADALGQYNAYCSNQAVAMVIKLPNSLVELV